MGKNKQPNAVSAKKAKQLDFQKVKFKVGKKLPKNLNETRATFKAKTLILKQQFQEKEGPVSHRNLTWKELLAHLGHLNQSVKIDALNSLKEMIVQNDDLIRLEFSNLLESVCPLFTDREYKVRENAIGLFKTMILLPLFKENNNQLLKPFYNLITVYLSCAMTHISDNIQYSSLKILDILVENLPELVKKNAYAIFDNFIEQISKASVKNDSKRILKNDPYKLTSTQSWRHNVLTRLQKILIIISKDYKDNTNKCEVNVLKTNQWILNQNQTNTDRQQLQICKKIINKKDITDINEFYLHYLKIVAPLLIECWIEAKPENKNFIENSESLGIMHLVLSIMNIMMDNLNLSLQDLTQFIKIPKSTTIETFVENLFLSDFPYILAENYDTENGQNKKAQSDHTSQISTNSLNLLICKFCSSSLLTMNEEKCLEILSYCLKSMDWSNFGQSSNNHELQIVLRLAKKIFKNFKDPKIVKPFLSGLVKFLDCPNKSFNNKLNVYEFLTNEFLENDNLLQFDNLFQLFFKKLLNFITLNLKEKKYDRIEILIDWLRNLSIRKHNQQNVLKLVENEYINYLNLADFKHNEFTETSRKKIIELINWLPKVNRYLFTKLAFLVLSNNLSLFNVNQLLSILKLKLENGSCNQTDYLMFLLHLFNGHSSYDLLHKNKSNKTEEFFLMENEDKFSFHVDLCQELESFVCSHKNSDFMINLILSSSLPVLNSTKSGIYTTTLYGTLSLISQIENINTLGSDYENLILEWLSNSFYWIASKYFDLKIEHIDTNKDSELIILEKLFAKSIQILYNEKVLNNFTSQILNMLTQVKDLENMKNVFMIVNFLLKNFSVKLQPSKFLFENILHGFQNLNSFNYSWWHEYVFLIKTIS